jgi:nitroimidazol reductase NimA-like FMN-containing flavoprotein (pyridoxamine 5'-phosphate oxidase superfamily)
VTIIDEYHLRQAHKSIDNQKELDEIILGQKYLTFAMSLDGEPYISTVNYYYDTDNRFFYFHCSPEGKKLKILRESPIIWGQIMEDRGYINGECDHAYTTVQFKGKVVFLTEAADKIEALTKMMEQLEDAPTKERLEGIKNRDMEKVAIGKIIVLGMSGKKNE